MLSPLLIMRGVKKTTNSVFSFCSWTSLKRVPTSGTLAKMGIRLVVRKVSSLINPPMIMVLPLLTITVVSAVVVSTIGISLPSDVSNERTTELTSGLILMIMLLSLLMVGVTYNCTPTSIKVTLSAVVV